MILTADQILNADDLPKETIKTPEWGKDGEVIVRTMTGKEREIFENQMTDKRSGKHDIRAFFCSLTVVDENGDQIFTSDQINQLNEKNCKVLDRIFFAAKKLNGLSEGDVEELAKN